MKVLYHGQHLNESHLRRINCTLQTLANDVWASIRTYDITYRKAYSRYVESYQEAADGVSYGNEATSIANSMYGILNQVENLQGTAEAIAAAEEAKSENDFEQAAEENDTPAPVVDGLPDEPSINQDDVNSDLAKALDDATNEANEKAQEALDAIHATQEAAQAAQDAVNNLGDAVEAQGYANPNAAAGTATYTNPLTGETQTVTNDGNGTVSISGVTWTDSEGNTHVGTVTQNPDGTMTVTDPSTGTSEAWYGGTPQDIATAGANAANQQAEDAMQDMRDKSEISNEKTQEYNEANAQKEAAQDAYNQAAQQTAEQMNENSPSGNDGGYSESDSSTWSDPSYDPSEWDF